MIRELGVNANKFTPAYLTAAVEMITGMGAVAGNDGTFKLPTQETADGIRFVEKEREVSGIYASQTDLDDYFDKFVTVKQGNFAKLITPMAYEVYAVDQYDTAIEASNVGKRLAVGTDGKWKIATVASRFVFNGFYQDGAHKLIEIGVMDTAASN